MKYIIVGGVAGGASTAARLRRLAEHATIILFEKGAYISYANCGLPYYIGDVVTDRNKLFVQTAASFKQRFNIDARVLSEVMAVNPQERSVTIKNVITGEEYKETYDKLVLTPGASPVRPPLPGIHSEGIFTLRNVTDTDRIKEYVQQFPNGKAVIIGAGFIGLEMAENLHYGGGDGRPGIGTHRFPGGGYSTATYP
jgi:NADPH-dependent 2,4-dienoyl-CoA reductase/sulfur reductase-like enzyme